MYVGNRLLPRHVILVLDAEAEVARCFEPASGASVTITRDAFLTGSLSLAGWDRPWFAVAALGTFRRSGTITGCPRPPRA